MAKVGELFIQRALKDSAFTISGYTAEESRFWVCTSAKYPTYGFKCGEKEIKCRKLQIDNFGCLTIRKKYQEKGYFTNLESAQKFHCFPLTNYHKAHEWMQKFHVKLGHPIPVLIKEPTEKPVETTTTSKDCPILSRARSSLSVESMGKLFEGEKSMLDPEEEELVDVPRDDEGYETDCVESCSCNYFNTDVHFDTEDHDEERLNELNAIQAYETRDEKDQHDEYYVHNTDFVWDGDHWRPTEARTPTEDNMVDYDTPKRKRSDSVETMPPTPKKKRMVGRFTISSPSPSPIPEIVNEVITEIISSTHGV